jgi:PadR family transcriptional regulator PadR
MSIQLKKGTLELCVLSLLARADRYGFALVGAISAEIKISEGTIYPLLKRIKDEGYVSTYLQESSEGPPRKYYRITDYGRQHFAELLTEWRAIVAGIEKIMADGTAHGGN